MSELDDVARLAGEHARAGERLRAAVAAAHAAGASVSDLARAGRVTRQTVYRWVAAAAGDGGRVEVRAALDAALELLGAILDGPNAATVRRRVGHRDVGVQVLGVEIGTASLPPGINAQLTEQERTVLGTGTLVAQEARRIHTSTGHWPESVPAMGIEAR